MGTVGAPELEAKRPEDSSWHPCRVALKPSYDAFTSSGLILDLECQSFEEVIFSKEEAMKRLRIRSTPLEGDDCFRVKEGEHVLASQTTKFGVLFFDAEVEKVIGVRHSKRNPCRCTFRIKWLCRQPGARVETVPASSIMKLATTPIDSHATVVEFLNSFAMFSCSGASSFASLSEEPDFEFDLEKQIEELSRLADVPEKEISEGRPGEPTKVDLTGQVRHRTLASQVSLSSDQPPHEQNNSRKNTRSRKKVLLESETIQSPPKPVTIEPDRPLLSPLGARAALASLMYKSSPMPEVPEYDVERDGFANVVQNTSMDHTMLSVDVNSTIRDSGPSTRKKVSIRDNLVSNEKDSPSPVDLQQPKVRRSGRRGASNSFLQTEEDNVGSMTESRRNSTTATRSAVQKGNGFSDNELNLKSSDEEMKPRSPTATHTSRFTRSAIQKETINGIVKFSERQQEKKLVVGTNSRLTRLRQNGTEHSDDEMDLKSSDEPKLLNQTPRFTRSAMQHSNNTVDPKSSSEEPNILGPIQTQRFTRSAIQKETRYLEVEIIQNEAVNGTIDNKKGQQKRKSAQGTNSRSTLQRCMDGVEHPKDETSPRHSYEEPKLLFPTLTHAPRFTRSAIHKETRPVEVEVLQKEVVNKKVGINCGLHEGELEEDTNCGSQPTNQKGSAHPNDEIESKSPSKETELHRPTRTSRLTRSAIQKGATNEMVEVSMKQEESQLAQQMCSDITRADFVTPQNKETRRKKPLTSSDDEVKLSVAQESNKKQRVSQDKGEIADKNSVSTKASLILRSSPRTRSQKKTCY